MSIIGLDAYGLNAFRSYSPPVRNIKYIEMKNGIYDELHVREKTDGIDLTTSKEDWQMDTILLARFLGELEAGNLNNRGIKINKFAIKRRKLNEINPITLGYKNFVNDNEFVFDDYSQANDDFIYSIVPIGENGLEGQANEISVSSDFAGWFILDREENEILAFDKFIGSESSVDNSMSQSRVEVDTLSKFKTVYYTDQEFHSFQLKSVFLPEDWQRSGEQYEDIINKYVRNHKPFLVKGGTGEVYICDIHSPSKSSPQNAYKGRDYMEITLNFTEIMDYEEYMEMTI